jgi:hypothetical protein
LRAKNGFRPILLRYRSGLELRVSFQLNASTDVPTLIYLYIGDIIPCFHNVLAAIFFVIVDYGLGFTNNKKNRIALLRFGVT